MPRATSTPRSRARYPELTNNFIVTGMFPDIAKPVWKDYRAAIKAYKADTKQDYNSLGGLGTWAAYTAFTKIASGVKGNLTNASFLAAANKTSNLDTGGMVPKIDFTKEWADARGLQPALQPLGHVPDDQERQGRSLEARLLRPDGRVAGEVADR